MELMPATRDEILAWFDRGAALGATHMIVVCDTFSYEDYPVFVMPGEDVHRARKGMQRAVHATGHGGLRPPA